MYQFILHNFNPFSFTGSGNKREYGNACGEGPSNKRQRISGVSNGNLLKNSRSQERLTEPQIQELLRRIVSLTDDWKCWQLESFRSSLERTCEIAEASGINDIFGPINECILRAISKMEFMLSRLKSEPNLRQKYNTLF